MNEIRVKPCGCAEMELNGSQTYFARIPIATTIYCESCGKKVTRPTMKMAIKAWNRRAKDEHRKSDD